MSSAVSMVDYAVAPLSGVRSVKNIKELITPYTGNTPNDEVLYYIYGREDFERTHGFVPYMTFDLRGVEEIDPEVLARIGTKARRIVDSHGRVQLVHVGEDIYRDVVAGRIDGQRMFAYVPEGETPETAVQPEVYTTRAPGEIRRLVSAIQERVRDWGFSDAETAEGLFRALSLAPGRYEKLHNFNRRELNVPGYAGMATHASEFRLLEAQRVLSMKNPDIEEHIAWSF